MNFFDLSKNLSELTVDEANYKQIKRKQKSITRLFPDFKSKVSGIGDKGGLRLKKTTRTKWHFKVHSGTKDDEVCYSYGVYTEQTSLRTAEEIEERIRKYGGGVVVEK